MRVTLETSESYTLAPAYWRNHAETEHRLYCDVLVTVQLRHKFCFWPNSRHGTGSAKAGNASVADAHRRSQENRGHGYVPGKSVQLFLHTCEYQSQQCQRARTATGKTVR